MNKIVKPDAIWITKTVSDDDKWDLYHWDKECEDEEDDEYISSTDAKFLKEWQEIVNAAETNVALQDLLDKVKMIYQLTKIK